ncbi:MAG: hypothetical protein MHM6MM_000338 [Cercozoa sp. M6MM]
MSVPRPKFRLSDSEDFKTVAQMVGASCAGLLAAWFVSPYLMPYVHGHEEYEAMLYEVVGDSPSMDKHTKFTRFMIHIFDEHEKLARHQKKELRGEEDLPLPVRNRIELNRRVNCLFFPTLEQHWNRLSEWLDDHSRHFDWVIHGCDHDSTVRSFLIASFRTLSYVVDGRIDLYDLLPANVQRKSLDLRVKELFPEERIESIEQLLPMRVLAYCEKSDVLPKIFGADLTRDYRMLFSKEHQETVMPHLNDKLRKVCERVARLHGTNELDSPAQYRHDAAEAEKDTYGMQRPDVEGFHRSGPKFVCLASQDPVMLTAALSYQREVIPISLTRMMRDAKSMDKEEFERQLAIEFMRVSEFDPEKDYRSHEKLFEEANKKEHKEYLENFVGQLGVREVLAEVAEKLDVSMYAKFRMPRRMLVCAVNDTEQLDPRLVDRYCVWVRRWFRKRAGGFAATVLVADMPALQQIQQGYCYRQLHALLDAESVDVQLPVKLHLVAPHTKLINVLNEAARGTSRIHYFDVLRDFTTEVRLHNDLEKMKLAE